MHPAWRRPAIALVLTTDLCVLVAAMGDRDWAWWTFFLLVMVTPLAIAWVVAATDPTHRHRPRRRTTSWLTLLLYLVMILTTNGVAELACSSSSKHGERHLVAAEFQLGLAALLAPALIIAFRRKRSSKSSDMP